MSIAYEDRSTEAEASPAKRNGRESSRGGARDTGDRYAPALVTSGRNATGEKEPSRLERSPGQKTFRASDAKSRLACAAILKSCTENIDFALDNASEFFLRNNALEQVKESLSKLWGYRQQREEPFAELVNAFQCVFAERDVECFENGQLEALRDAFEDVLDAGEIEDHVANSISLRLLRAGVDVFRELE